jgi:hypothetical protein
MDDKCDTPVGFNIIFPGMIKSGIDLGLELPLRQSDFDEILRLQVKRFVIAADVQIHFYLKRTMP